MNALSRRRLLSAVTAIGLWPGSTRAAPRRMGVLLYDRAASWAFLQRELADALARFGWHEGRTLTSDWRFADGDASRLDGLADALVRGGADVLMARGTPATRALQNATRVVPIVTGVGDPVGAGFAASLAAPGGNITGLSYAAVESTTKQLEMLREMAPAVRALLVLVSASRAPFVQELTATVERVAARMDLRTQPVMVSRAQDLRAALPPPSAGPPGTVAAYVFGLGTEVEPKDLASAMLRARVPTVFEYRTYVDAGGLLSYRFNWPDQTHRAAVQLDKVLRGESPARIPFELPTHSELVINARTARQLGLTIPHALRVRADAIIE